MTTTTAPARRAGEPTPAGGGLRRFWNRQLPNYPNTGPRTLYLAITVLATVVLYYELYVGGSVATKIIAEFGFSFTYYVMVSVVGNLVGAFASLFAGLADRWGRANLVVGGLLITGLIILVGLPNVHSRGMWMLLFGSNTSPSPGGSVRLPWRPRKRRHSVSATAARVASVSPVVTLTTAT